MLMSIKQYTLSLKINDEDVLVETSKENSKSDVGVVREVESQIYGGGSFSRKLKSQFDPTSPKNKSKMDLHNFDLTLVVVKIRVEIKAIEI